MARKRLTEESREEKLARLTSRLSEQLQPNSVPLLKEVLYLSWQEGYDEAFRDAQEGY